MARKKFVEPTQHNMIYIQLRLSRNEYVMHCGAQVHQNSENQMIIENDSTKNNIISY